jgi:tetratricopeptide (TPR) repeat protein
LQAPDEIAARLAGPLTRELFQAAGGRIEREKRSDLAASDLVIQGWAVYYRPSSYAALNEAQRIFQSALEVDPGSIDALIGLATVLARYINEGHTSASGPHTTRAEQLLAEVLERDANRPLAYHALGFLRRAQNRLVESRTAFEMVIALNPNDADGLIGMGNILMYLGEPDEAIPHLDKAMRLSPRDKHIASCYWALGSCHLLIGNVGRAIDLLKRARAENPRFWYVHAALAGALGLNGDIPDAHAALLESLKLRPQINSLMRWRELAPWNTYPKYWDLREKTLNVGLRRAGMPDE